jgi:micrococcal nuclease
MYEYRVKKVTGVVDGDTIDVELDLGFNISYSQRVRLAGIDTPESRTKDKMEKALGLEVKQKLKDTLANAKVIVIRTELPDSSEKYGRILGWIFLDGAEQSVNEALVADGYAWGYLGDTKVKDFDALLTIRRTKQMRNDIDKHYSTNSWD